MVLAAIINAARQSHASVRDLAQDITTNIFKAMCLCATDVAIQFIVSSIFSICTGLPLGYAPYVISTAYMAYEAIDQCLTYLGPVGELGMHTLVNYVSTDQYQRYYGVEPSGLANFTKFITAIVLPIPNAYRSRELSAQTITQLEGECAESRKSIQRFGKELADESHIMHKALTGLHTVYEELKERRRQVKSGITLGPRSKLTEILKEFLPEELEGMQAELMQFRDLCQNRTVKYCSVDKDNQILISFEDKTHT